MGLGTITALLGAGVVFVILTGKPSTLFGRIKDTATAMGAVVAASALAWSHFFQTGARSDDTARIEALIQKVAEISRQIDRIAPPKELEDSRK